MCLETWFIYNISIYLELFVGVERAKQLTCMPVPQQRQLVKRCFGGGRFSSFLDYCVCTCTWTAVCTCTCVYLHVALAFCGLLCTVQSFQHLLYASSHCSHLVLYYLLRIVFFFFPPHSGIVIIIELYSVILLPHFAQKYRNES